MPLVRLRCPEGCLLGIVEASGDGLRLAVRRRVLVQVAPDRAEAQTQELVVPWTHTGQVDLGCRHSVGEPLDEELWSRIDAHVQSVRTGTTRRGATVILRAGEPGGLA